MRLRVPQLPASALVRSYQVLLFLLRFMLKAVKYPGENLTRMVRREARSRSTKGVKDTKKQDQSKDGPAGAQLLTCAQRC